MDKICSTDIEKAFSRATEAVIAKLRDAQAVYMFKTSSKASVDQPPPAIIRGVQLDFNTDLSKVWPSVVGGDGFDANSLSCSYFSMKSKAGSPIFSVEVRKMIDFILLFSFLCVFFLNFPYR